ncbi:MAG: hypothetical protein ABEJ93_01130 [Candidatus Nanohalobium sp.]
MSKDSDEPIFSLSRRGLLRGAVAGTGIGGAALFTSSVISMGKNNAEIESRVNEKELLNDLKELDFDYFQTNPRGTDYSTSVGTSTTANLHIDVEVGDDDLQDMRHALTQVEGYLEEGGQVFETFVDHVWMGDSLDEIAIDFESDPGNTEFEYSIGVPEIREYRAEGLSLADIYRETVKENLRKI